MSEGEWEDLEIEIRRYKFKNYQFVLALVFAIEEVNRNPHLLPNTSLGFDLYNIPFSEKNTLMNAFIWLTGMNDVQANYNCKEERKKAAALTYRNIICYISPYGNTASTLQNTTEALYFSTDLFTSCPYLTLVERVPSLYAISSVDLDSEELSKRVKLPVALIVLPVHSTKFPMRQLPSR
ncbi:hypothetical protein STEG23_032497 [Scotinomys teguina]